MRCLAKKPDDRYQNLTELKSDLKNLSAVGRVKTSAPPALLVSVGLAVCLVVLIFLQISNKQPDKPQATAVTEARSTADASSSTADGAATNEAATDEATAIAAKQKALLSAQVAYARLKKEGDPEGAYLSAKKAARLAEELNLSPFEQAYNLKRLADAESGLQRPRAAFKIWERVVELIKEPQNPADLEFAYESYMAYGDLLRNQGWGEKAEVAYQSAFNMAVQQKNQAHQSASYIYMGLCEKENKQYAKCEEYWTQALKLNPLDDNLKASIEDLKRHPH